VRVRGSCVRVPVSFSRLRGSSVSVWVVLAVTSRGRVSGCSTHGGLCTSPACGPCWPAPGAGASVVAIASAGSTITTSGPLSSLPGIANRP